MSNANSVQAGPAASLTPVQNASLLTAGGVRGLAGAGFLDAHNYEKALSFLGIRPTAKSWIVFWFRILLVTGLLFFLAGVFCFFAWNWSEMSHFQKFGVLAALMLMSAALPLWRGVDSLPGGLGLLACGILAGPLLAVYGQYYQTGADAWELFRAWALFLIPLAVIGRQNGLWVAAWIVGSLWAGLYLAQTAVPQWEGGSSIASRFWWYMLCQILVLALWEAAAYQARNRKNSFLHASWTMRLVAVCLFVALSWLNAWHIVSFGYNDDVLLLVGSPLISAAAHAFLLLAGFCWYRFKRPDTFILTVGFLSLIFLFFVWIYSKNDLFNAGGMLLGAVLLAGCAFGTAKLVMHWHRQALKRKTPVDEDRKGARSLMFIRTRTLPQLFAWLGQGDASAAEKALDENIGHLMPWYVRLMLTLCGWISAIFLMAFLGFIIEGQSRNAELLLLSFGFIFLVASVIMCRTPSLFARQFGLALGIAGLIIFPIGIIMQLKMEGWFQLPVLATALCCLIFIRQQAMRCVAFLVVIFTCTDLLVVFFNWSMETAAETFALKAAGKAFMYVFAYSCIGVSVLLFAGLAAFLVRSWENEMFWVQSKKKDEVLRPVLFALCASFLVMGALYAAFGGDSYKYMPELHYIYSRFGAFLSMCNWAGIGAGIGLIFLARGILRKGTGGAGQKAVIYCGAIAFAVAGWWLPWLPIAILLLALGRYLGSMAVVGFAAVFLTCCINWYYYSLRTSLLYKSYTLCGAGVVMLIFGCVLYRVFRELVSGPDPDEPGAPDVPGAPDAVFLSGPLQVSGNTVAATPDMPNQGGDHA